VKQGINNQNYEELIKLVNTLSHAIHPEQQIPAIIFSTQLSPAEALVKYLKEDKKIKLAEIGRLLNRDQRGIWTTYNRACEKYTQKLPTKSEHNIPLAIYKDRKYSILEHTVNHLRQKIPIKEIAKILKKSPSTIATVHHRVRHK